MLLELARVEREKEQYQLGTWKSRETRRKFDDRLRNNPNNGPANKEEEEGDIVDDSLHDGCSVNHENPASCSYR